MLAVNHCNGTADGTAVDEKVEVDVNPGSRCRGVDNLLLSVLLHAYVGLLVLVLFGNQGRDVTLEAAGAETHDHKTDREDTDGNVWLDNNCGDRRHDEDDVPDNSNDVGVLDRVVAAPVLVSEPGATERCDVGPELIEHCQAGRCTLAHVESTRTRLLEETSPGFGAGRERLLNKVCRMVRII